MTTLGQAQLGGKAESTYGTPVTVDRFWPFISFDMVPDYGVVSASDEIRAGSLVERVDQDDPYIIGGAGSLEMYVQTKGFGIWLSHALGSAAIGTITDSNYTQTFLLSATGKTGKSMTLQDAHPFNAVGTAQPLTWHGCKVLSVELSCDEEGYVKAAFELDSEDVDTSTSLAVASYPSIAVGAARFPWRTSTVTVDGAQLDVTTWRVKIAWPMNTDRRYVRGSALKKEPTVTGKATIEWELEADFASLDQYNLVAAASITDRVAPIVITCDGVVALAGATVPQLKVTLPAARFDKALPPLSGEAPLMQALSGVGLDNDVDEPVTITYRTTDSAA
jgi:hypothetical protein